MEEEKKDDNEIGLPTMEEFKKQQENSSQNEQIPNGSEIHSANISSIYPDVDDLKSIVNGSQERSSGLGRNPNNARSYASNDDSNKPKPTGITEVGKKGINFYAIIKNSWLYPIKNKYLWCLGILMTLTLGISGLCGGILNLIRNNNRINVLLSQSNIKEPTPSSYSFLPKSIKYDEILKLYDQLSKNISDFLLNHKMESNLIILGSLVLSIVAIYVSYRITAAMIIAANNLDDGHDSENIKSAYTESKPFFWRLFGLYILLWLLGAILSFALSAIVVSLALTSVASLAFIIPLGTLIAIPLSLYILLIIQFAQRYIVLGDMGIFESLANAKSLIDASFWTSVSSVIINIVIMLIVGVIEYLVYLLSIYLVFRYISDNTNVWNNPVQLVSMLAITSVLFIINLFIIGLIQSFFSTYWTLSYRAFEYSIDHWSE